MSAINKTVTVKLSDGSLCKIVIEKGPDRDGWCIGYVKEGKLYYGCRICFNESEIQQERIMLTSQEARELSHKAMKNERLRQISHKIKCQAEKGCYSLFLPEREIYGMQPADFQQSPYNYKVVHNESGYIISWE